MCVVILKYTIYDNIIQEGGQATEKAKKEFNVTGRGYIPKKKPAQVNQSAIIYICGYKHT